MRIRAAVSACAVLFLACARDRSPTELSHSLPLAAISEISQQMGLPGEAIESLLMEEGSGGGSPFTTRVNYWYPTEGDVYLNFDIRNSRGSALPRPATKIYVCESGNCLGTPDPPAPPSGSGPDAEQDCPDYQSHGVTLGRGGRCVHVIITQRQTLNNCPPGFFTTTSGPEGQETWSLSNTNNAYVNGGGVLVTRYQGTMTIQGVPSLGIPPYTIQASGYVICGYGLGLFEASH